MFCIRIVSTILSIIFLLCLSLNVYADSKGEALKHMQRQEWSEAINHAKKSGDKTLLKVILAHKFQNADTKCNHFEDIIVFIKNNPNWPNKTKLLEAAELSITENTNPHNIVAWFKVYPPTTGYGKKFYAIAASKAIKDQLLLQKIIKNGWIHGDFSLEEQNAFLKKHKTLLTPHDHAHKIDYLLWEGNTKQASVLMPLIDQNSAKLFKTAIAMERNGTNADHIFANATNNQKHSSILLYQYLKSHLKDDHICERLADLAANAPADHAHASEWWKVKVRILREQIKHKRYKAAYNIAANHHAVSSEDVSDAEFLAGWLALRYLKQPSLALTHFHRLKKVVKTPISLSRAKYWLGRTELALGHKEAAHKWFRDAATYYYAFYGQLALLELGNKAITLPKKPQITDKHHVNLGQNEFARAAKMLTHYNMDDLAIPYVKAFLVQTRDPAEVLLAIDYIREKKSLSHIVSLAKAASYNGILLVNDAFPTKHKISGKFIEPALAYAIIRQETLFDQHAISNRNAHGLMQVLPTTACSTAKTLQMKCKPAKYLLTDTIYNTTLGTKTFKDYLDKCGGSYILAIASYNAGPHKAPEWSETYGDPRKMKTMHQVVDWIEKIPYGETRNYVQRVLENLQVYRAILNKKSTLRLAEDLGVKI